MNLRLVDWMLPEIEGELALSHRRLIQEVHLVVTNVGYRNWMEAPLGTATAEQMEPILDLSENAQHRAVFGYYAWGLPINRQNHIWMWTPARHINWKRNFLTPEIRTPALRVWLREGVEAHAWVNWYDPADATQLPVLVSPP